jgi:hypothetical protein
MYSKFILHNFARIQKVSNGHGGDGQNRTDPIFPYEGNAQTFYATSPKLKSTLTNSTPKNIEHNTQQCFKIIILSHN